jgi:hypothetical protein
MIQGGRWRSEVRNQKPEANSECGLSNAEYAARSEQELSISVAHNTQAVVVLPGRGCGILSSEFPFVAVQRVDRGAAKARGKVALVADSFDEVFRDSLIGGVKYSRIEDAPVGADDKGVNHFPGNRRLTHGSRVSESQLRGEEPFQTAGRESILSPDVNEPEFSGIGLFRVAINRAGAFGDVIVNERFLFIARALSANEGGGNENGITHTEDTKGTKVNSLNLKHSVVHLCDRGVKIFSQAGHQ